MKKAFCLVVNPAAGGGRSTRLLPAAVGTLAAGSAGVRVCETGSLGHAADTAIRASGRGETVVAVGGDGLVGSLAAAMAGVDGPLGIIPAGRGNDFARMLRIPFRPAAAASALLTGSRRAVDLIGVSASGGPEQIVAGSVYLGVVAEGGELVNAHPRGGTLGYQLAGVRALARWRCATFTVAKTGTRGGPGVRSPGLARFPGFCVVVANSAYLAAGKIAAPAADVTDGLLDVVMVRDGRKLAFVQAMMMADRGTHVRLSQVSTARAASVTVSADRAMPAGADGETLGCASPLAAGAPLRIRALPGALRVITPARAPAGVSCRHAASAGPA